jgi:putative endonuclease
MLFSGSPETEGKGRSVELGRRGEQLAAEYLVDSGYRLVMSNFRIPIGRTGRGALATGELDIIALYINTLCFIEVKTRADNAPLEPEAALVLRKQRQIIRTARAYRRVFKVEAIPSRFDVVSVVLASGRIPQLEIIKDHFSEASFNKASWTGDVWHETF